MTISVAINLTPVPPAELTAAAILAEQLGYESAWIGEHVIIPADARSDSPYDQHPVMPTHMRFYEPFVALAHLAASTTTLRLGTGVAILPLRDPFLTARAITTADALAGGRLLVGMGAGWMKEEFDIMGVPFAGRGSRFDEQLALIKQLLGEEHPEHHGALWDLPVSGFEPKPVQRPHPPLLIGGISEAALTRCARYGDGWYGSRHTPDEVAGVKQRLAELGPDPLPLSVGAVVGASLEEYTDAGAERVLVTPWKHSEEWRAGMTACAVEFELTSPSPSADDHRVVRSQL